MTDNTGTAQHYVCTYEEARRLLAAQTAFYLRTCGCRERHPGNHADNNCCLWFTSAYPDIHGPSEEISPEAVRLLVERARETGWIVRPFRDFDTLTEVIGICFCCTCCCSYFNDIPREACDKGACIEQTELSKCTACGLCVAACHFAARAVPQGQLQLDRTRCFGCGLCVESCPTGAIGMVARE